MLIIYICTVCTDTPAACVYVCLFAFLIRRSSHVSNNIIAIISTSTIFHNKRISHNSDGQFIHWFCPNSMQILVDSQYHICVYTIYIHNDLPNWTYVNCEHLLWIYKWTTERNENDEEMKEEGKKNTSILKSDGSIVYFECVFFTNSINKSACRAFRSIFARQQADQLFDKDILCVNAIASIPYYSYIECGWAWCCLRIEIIHEIHEINACNLNVGRLLLRA